MVENDIFFFLLSICDNTLDVRLFRIVRQSAVRGVLLALQFACYYNLERQICNPSNIVT